MLFIKGSYMPSCTFVNTMYSINCGFKESLQLPKLLLPLSSIALEHPCSHLSLWFEGIYYITEKLPSGCFQLQNLLHPKDGTWHDFVATIISDRRQRRGILDMTLYSIITPKENIILNRLILTFLKKKSIVLTVQQA